ncbi:hypothetical protein U1Q18_020454 [Sarracenia purpurea var. burkii]
MPQWPSAPCAPDLVLLLYLSTPDLVLFISEGDGGGGTVVEGGGGAGTVAPSSFSSSSSSSSSVATARVAVGSLRARSGSPPLPKHTRSVLLISEGDGGGETVVEGCGGAGTGA